MSCLKFWEIAYSVTNEYSVDFVILRQSNLKSIIGNLCVELQDLPVSAVFLYRIFRIIIGCQ